MFYNHLLMVLKTKFKKKTIINNRKRQFGKHRIKWQKKTKVNIKKKEKCDLSELIGSAIACIIIIIHKYFI